MKILLLILALITLLDANPLVYQRHSLKQPPLNVSTAIGADWTDCSQSNELAEVVSVKLTPDPPKKGEDLTVDADINLKEGVDKGSSIKLTITYGIFNIPVNTVTFDLCSVASKGCPLSPGDVTLSISEEIPGFSPPGNYKGKAEATDQNGRELVCIEMKFSL